MDFDLIYRYFSVLAAFLKGYNLGSVHVSQTERIIGGYRQPSCTRFGSSTHSLNLLAIRLFPGTAYRAGQSNLSFLCHALATCELSLCNVLQMGGHCRKSNLTVCSCLFLDLGHDAHAPLPKSAVTVCQQVTITDSWLGPAGWLCPITVQSTVPAHRGISGQMPRTDGFHSV